MTTRTDLSAALEDIWHAYASGSWRTNRPTALRLVQDRTDHLRALASQVDPESWPREVLTYLWRLPDRLS